MFLLYEFIVWFGTLNQKYQDMTYWYNQHVEVYHEAGYYYSCKNFGEQRQMLTLKFRNNEEWWWSRYRYYSINYNPDNYPETINVGGTHIMFDNMFGDVIIFGDINPSDEDNIHIVDEQKNTLYHGRVEPGYLEKIWRFMHRGRQS